MKKISIIALLAAATLVPHNATALSKTSLAKADEKQKAQNALSEAGIEVTDARIARAVEIIAAGNPVNTVTMGAGGGPAGGPPPPPAGGPPPPPAGGPPPPPGGGPPPPPGGGPPPPGGPPPLTAAQTALTTAGLSITDVNNIAAADALLGVSLAVDVNTVPAAVALLGAPGGALPVNADTVALQLASIDVTVANNVTDAATLRTAAIDVTVANMAAATDLRTNGVVAGNVTGYIVNTLADPANAPFRATILNYFVANNAKPGGIVEVTAGPKAAKLRGGNYMEVTILFKTSGFAGGALSDVLSVWVDDFTVRHNVGDFIAYELTTASSGIRPGYTGLANQVGESLTP